VSEWWNELSIEQLDKTQWEALCDGCAKCCLHKLQEDGSGEVFYTKVSCRYLDEASCRCTDYANRLEMVPNCIELDLDDLQELHWLPATCAYRLRAQGISLPAWHPLVSGDPESVHRAGISVRGRVISEEYVHPDGYEEHIVVWAD